MKKRIFSIILCLALIIASCSTAWTMSSAKAKPVKLNVSKKTLKVGKKYQLKVKKAKGITIKKKSFTKKGAAVSVSKKGKVTAKKAGKATVSCKVKYKVKGKKKIYKKTLKCKITVQAAKGTESTAPGQASAPASSQETPASSVEQSAMPTGTMDPSQEPGSSPTPNGSSAPEVSSMPGSSSAPEVSSMPGGSSAPGASLMPSSSSAPGTSSTPSGTAAPGASSMPSSSSAPGASFTPSDSPIPGSSSTPSDSPAPKDTNSPSDTKEPAATAAPAGTSAAPENTSSPSNTTKPTATTTPAPNYPSVEFDSAFEFIKDMGLGINLGNTMEACGDWIDSSSPSNYEIAWQPDETKTITTPTVIQGMRDAGFKTLRIPVAWSNMMAKDGTYTINEAYFNRIDEIIGYAMDAGMYTLINIHWDGGWWEQFGSNDETERQEAMKKYKAMWTQLAEHYKDYSNMLIFESANEELGPGLSPTTEDGKLSGYYTSDDGLYELTNEINQTFVNIVRESGGKNVDRYLLIAGYNTDIAKTCDNRFQMPADTIADHLMVSVHYYDPSTYCLVEDPNNSWGYQDSWGTDNDIKEMQSALSKLKLYYTNQGIPVIIGEYGVVSSEPKSGRDLYFRTLCEYALENGMCPVLWENSGLVYKRSTASMIYEDEAKLYLELEKKAEAMDAFAPDEGDGSYSWSGTLATENGGWNFSAVSNSADDTLILSTVTGSCYKLAGVDWSKYSAPKLEIKASGFDGTVTVGLSTQLNTANPDWCYIEEYEEVKTIQPSSGGVIDLSSLNLSGTQSLYLVIVKGSKTEATIWDREDFSGDFTIRISD